MSNNVENLSPQTIRGVAREMQDLVNNPPEGIKVQINDEDVTDIQAFIEGPAGKQIFIICSAIFLHFAKINGFFNFKIH